MRKRVWMLVFLGAAFWLDAQPARAAAALPDCGGRYVACLEQSREDTGAPDYHRCGAEYNECVRRSVIRS